jgi:hypothetical protein
MLCEHRVVIISSPKVVSERFVQRLCLMIALAILVSTLLAGLVTRARWLNSRLKTTTETLNRHLNPWLRSIDDKDMKPLSETFEMVAIVLWAVFILTLLGVAYRVARPH